MIIIKLKNCCYECNCPDVDIDINYMSAIICGRKEIFESRTDCKIYCKHDKVCKAYLESEE